ncbi:hypothetical protein ACOJTA_08320 [Malaciobacter sp. WC5094]
MNLLTLQDDFKTLDFDSKEKIKSNNLKDFIFTSLLLHDEESYENKTIYINPLFKSNKYQVFLCSDEFTKFFFEAFTSFCTSKEETLVISKNFFCVYIEKKFYYFKELEYELSPNKIEDFIFTYLGIRIKKIVNINHNELDEIYGKYSNNKSKTTLININRKTNHSLLYFITYLISLLFFAYGFYFYSQIEQDKNIQKQKQAQIIKLNEKRKRMYFKSFHKDFTLFNEYLRDNNLNLITFKYKGKNYTFSISSKAKKPIFDFLNTYKKQIVSSNLKLNKQEYVFHGNIVFNK